MAVKRRHFLAGMAALGLSARSSWAAAGAPDYLAAARDPDGSYALYGIDGRGEEIFRIPLPGRGHAGAAHPFRAEAIAFARRPGTFAMVIDCVSGQERTRLESPEGRHFYGHGTFSADGRLLYTPENDYDAARGVVGIWDVDAGYRRVGEVDSGGVGPHDVLLLPGGRQMIVANGGIETHPATGRAKLNLPVMRGNLALLSLEEGRVLRDWALPQELHLNSLRHLALGAGGQVAVAMQWQGDSSDPVPLLALLDPGADALRILMAPDAIQRRMNGYAGSVAFDPSGERVAITSPRGGQLMVFDAASGELVGVEAQRDVCGIAAAPGGFLASDGEGRMRVLDHNGQPLGATRHRAQWDNHIVALPPRRA